MKIIKKVRKPEHALKVTCEICKFELEITIGNVYTIVTDMSQTCYFQCRCCKGRNVVTRKQLKQLA